MRDDALVPAFYHDCPPDDVALARKMLTPEVRKISLTPAHTTPNRFGAVRRIYIECTQDRAILIDAQREMVRLVDTAMGNKSEVHTLETSHSPFHSNPDALVGILADIARR